MFRRLNRQISVFLAALLGVIVGSVGPGVARAAYDAVNADKVDGKHAVGAGASISYRKGKLVATSPTTGLLPNNIIAKASDSAKLNGYAHSSMRFLSLATQAAYVSDGATKGTDGVGLPAAGASTFNIGFLVPPDHKAGDPLLMDVLFSESSDVACGMYFFTGGTNGPNGDVFNNGGWYIPGPDAYQGTLDLPADTLDGHTATFTWAFGSDPGHLVSFRLTRAGDNVADTCGGAQVVGLQLRY
jgi:hypothetical protein